MTHTNINTATWLTWSLAGIVTVALPVGLWVLVLTALRALGVTI